MRHTSDGDNLKNTAPNLTIDSLFLLNVYDYVGEYVIEGELLKERFCIVLIAPGHPLQTCKASLATYS